jgi:putative oxidoreductase
MKLILRFLFGPGTNSPAANLGLLLLRVWFGLSMLVLHGWPKLAGFNEKSKDFHDLLGIGSPTSLALAVFAEVVCAALIVLGLFGRFAALAWAGTMAVAFTQVHHYALSGAKSGELAFIYLGASAVLLVAGSGGISLDARLFGKRATDAPVPAKK